MIISKSDLVLFLFIINALVAITSDLDLGGGLHMGYIRAGLMIVILPLLIRSIKWNKTTISIIITLLYLLFVLSTNTHFWSNFSTYVGVALSLLMYPLCFTYLYKQEHLEKLSKIIVWLLLIFGLQFIIFNSIGVGRYAYGMTYLGYGGVGQAMILSYLLLFVPFMYYYYPRKFGLFEYASFALALVPIFFIFRRGAVLALILGLVVYMVLTARKGKVYSFGIIAGIVLIIASPLYLDYVQLMYETRPTDLDRQHIEQIGRSQEIIVWAPYWMEQKGLAHTMFGSELYDYQTLAGVTRSLHADYAVYLIGAGIVGFILYFSVIFFLWMDFLSYANKIKQKFIRKELAAVLASITVAYFILSYSGQYYVISLLSTGMLLFGVINRKAYELSKNSH